MKTRWEYKIVEGGDGWKGETVRKNTEAKLNALGSEGWECYHVATLEDLYYLKRER